DVMICYFQAEDGIRDRNVTGVQTCALPILIQIRFRYSCTVQLTFTYHSFHLKFSPRICQSPLNLRMMFYSNDGSARMHIMYDKRSEERRVGYEGRYVVGLYCTKKKTRSKSI